MAIRTLKLILSLNLILLSFVIVLMAWRKLSDNHEEIAEAREKVDRIPARIVYTLIQKQNLNNTLSTKLLILSRDFLTAESSDNLPYKHSYSKSAKTYRIHRLLNYRKLVLFVANEMNRNAAKYECKLLKYWANPLNIEEIEETEHRATKIYNLTFKIEPGHLPIRAIIQQDPEFLNKPFKVGIQNELRLLFFEILDPEYRFAYEHLNCSNHEVKILIKKTDEARNEWNATDMEQTQFPPNSSMLITHYFSYGTKSFYLISPKNPYTKFCKAGLKMLILIHSAPYHFLERNIIRKTYGHKTLLERQKVGLLFFLGNVDDSWIQKDIAAEAAEFDDIVLLDVQDSYHNLTLKHLGVFNWFYTFCGRKEPLPKWILKADDDYFINVDLVLNYSIINPSVQLLGCVGKSTVVRHDSSYSTWQIRKWYTPKYMYAPYAFENYLQGLGYLVQSKVIPKFLQASLNVPIMHVDDAFVAGILALQIGVNPVNYEILCPNREEGLPCQVLKKFDGYGNIAEQWTKFKAKTENENCESNADLKVPNPDPKDTRLYQEVSRLIG